MQLSPDLTASIDPELGLALISQARAAITEKLGLAADTPMEHTALNSPGATFVTLKLDDELRGCIGQLETTRTLRRDVRENAVAAASRDPRFPPLTVAEWARTSVEISLLGPITFQTCSNEKDALTMMTPGLDGIVLNSGGRRATFLPQVWETLPHASDFLAQLRLKAGLHKAWPEDMLLGRYRVAKFAE